MESPFYGYYYISTDCVSNTLDTKEIESYLLNEDHLVNEGNGIFKHTLTFLNLQLMLVKSYDSWSGNDYNERKTNYISIVTRKKLEPNVKQFFQDFERFIGWRIIEELDDD